MLCISELCRDICGQSDGQRNGLLRVRRLRVQGSVLGGCNERREVGNLKSCSLKLCWNIFMGV